MKLNLRLIGKLSLFGLFMGIATVYFITTAIEPVCWALIFVFCAYQIAKYGSANYFLHGFLLGIANCFWITATHILLFHQYLSNHPQEVEMMAKMPLQGHPRLKMLITGPVIGIISGLVLGLFSYLA